MLISIFLISFLFFSSLYMQETNKIQKEIYQIDNLNYGFNISYHSFTQSQPFEPGVPGAVLMDYNTANKYANEAVKKVKLNIFQSFMASAAVGDWTALSDITGIRSFAYSFSIDDSVYVGGGSANWGGSFLSNFWEYNTLTDTWTQKADYGGGVRGEAASFSISDFGYVGCGFDTAWNKHKDFYKYNSNTNTWTSITDFPGTARVFPVAFVIGNYGYVGTGASDTTPNGEKDFYKLNSADDTWSSISNITVGRHSAVAFSISEYGYVGTGHDETTSYSSGFYKYNPSTDVWTTLTNFPGTARKLAVGVSVSGTENLGIVGSGDTGAGNTKDFYTYNATTNTWTAITDFTTLRRGATASSIGENAYIGMGEHTVICSDWYKYEATSPIPEPPISAPLPVSPPPVPTPIPIPPEEPILTIIEEFIDFISTSYNWIFILLAYLGALIPKITTDKNTRTIIVDTLLYGTIAWILILILNIFIPVISISEILSMIIFFFSGLIISLLSNLNSEPEKKKPRRKH